MTIYIKNMVSTRCKMTVESVLTSMDIPFIRVELGLADITGDISMIQHNQIRAALLLSGLELIEDIKSVLIERIKKVIIELIHYNDEPLTTNFSDYLSKTLNHEYTYMANLFSEIEGINVEHYLITHKIERVKELLVYDKLSLTAISYKLNYSSVAHLCNQFKKITGLTPSHFRKSKEVN